MTRPATEDNELPEGWVQTRVADICHLNPPKPTPDEVASKTQVTFVPMPAVDADARAITNPQVRPFAEVRKGFTSFRDNDVILAKITPCFENKKAAVCRGLSNGLGFGSTEFHVLRSNGSVLPEYVYHFTRQESFLRDGESNMTGSVGQKRVPAGWLASVAIPLPPLAEQGRIVAKVEELLGRVSAARARLAKVPALLKRFRQSILAAACSGQLTADWRSDAAEGDGPGLLAKIVRDRSKTREANRSRVKQAADEIAEPLHELPDGWAWATLQQIGQEGRPVIYGIIKPGPHVPGGVPYVRVTEMKDGFVNLPELRRASPERAAKFSRATLACGDLLISKDGTIGRVAVVPKELEGGNITQHLVRAAIHRHMNRDYVVYAIRSPASQAWLTDEKLGVALQGVNVEDFRRLPLPIPPHREQAEIVRRVDGLFALADKIEARVSAATARVEKITQAILAKAFRGELVPTEAELARQEGRDYEPAAVLLDRIRAERTTGDSSAPKPRSPRGRRAGHRAPRRGPRRP